MARPRLPDTTGLLSHLTGTKLDVVWCGRLGPLVQHTLYWALARECFQLASLLGDEDRMHSLR